MPNINFSLHFLTKEVLLDLALSPNDIMENEQWNFSDRLEKLPYKQLSSSYTNHTFLKIKYQALCAELIKNAKQYEEDKQTNHIISILMLTQLLEHMQLHGTDAELTALQHTEAICRNHLQKLGITVPKYRFKQKPKDILDINEDTIKATTTQLDFWRLIINRGRRALFWSIPLINNFDYYGRFAIPLNDFLRTVVLFQACVLIPRFITNILHLFKHAWSPNKNELCLSALERHQIRLNMNGRWSEIAYDFGWITNGLLNAFVLTGSLAPFAIYTSILSSSYNLFLHTTRLYVEDNRFKKLEDFYKRKRYQSTSDQEALKTFLEQLSQHRKYNKNALSLRVAVSIVVVSTGIFTTWIVSAPLIPFIAAIFSVLATIAGKIIPAYLPKQQDKLKASDLKPSSLLNHTLFSNRHPSSQALAEQIVPDVTEEGLVI
ncbi:MAG: hypothetical protein K0U37_09000 [Gammaproteobacteria bacterium]|nr:hypothetical protein [Gammaproteobacteria bacterium]